MKDDAAMYLPERFREDDLPTLHALMRDYSFATLVTQHEGMPFASHLPLMPEAELRQKLQGIVTFAVRITRLEGKLKLSQNRALTDQQRVAAILQYSANPVSRDVGTSMQQRQAARRT